MEPVALPLGNASSASPVNPTDRHEVRAINSSSEGKLPDPALVLTKRSLAFVERLAGRNKNHSLVSHWAKLLDYGGLECLYASRTQVTGWKRRGHPTFAIPTWGILTLIPVLSTDRERGNGDWQLAGT